MRPSTGREQHCQLSIVYRGGEIEQLRFKTRTFSAMIARRIESTAQRRHYVKPSKYKSERGLLSSRKTPAHLPDCLICCGFAGFFSD